MNSTSRLKVLIVGAGGREHALAWKVSRSDRVSHVFVAPGNAGTALEQNTTSIAIEATDMEALVDFAKKESIDLTIVGPEAPLAAGIVDYFEAHQLHCLGPTQAAAQLETSKAFCKQFLQEEQIPTARFATFTDEVAALRYLEHHSIPVVIKASGLAAGKGVVIAESRSQAEATVSAMLSGRALGEAGRTIVIEEFLEGEELSVMALLDGENALLFPGARDYKRRDEGDHGPNTGGMGAYSLAPPHTQQANDIMQHIIQPTMQGLRRRGLRYRGFLYAGLMITPSGDIKVLEYNCRLGDPETQVLLLRLQSDFVSLCLAALQTSLDQASPTWDPRPAVCLVLTAGGYPSSYQKGDPITGWDRERDADCKVFHAGTRKVGDQLLTHGGRVLGVASLGDNLQAARQTVYRAAEGITWAGRYYRQDIAAALKH